MYYHHWLAAGAVAIGLMASPGPAAADSWVGASIGESESDRFCGLFSFGVNCDDTDTAVKAQIGLQVAPFLGIEGFWADLGRVRARDSAGDSVRIDVDGFGVALLPTLPVNDAFDLYGRVGAYTWDADARAVIGGTTIRSSDDGTDPVYGIGSRVYINRNFAVRVEWEQFELDDEDVTLFSLGAELRF